MKVFKGFVTIASLINNTPTIVSRLGELSPLAYTYSRVVGVYSDPDSVGYRAVMFTARDVTTSEPVVMIQSQTKMILDLVRFIKTYGASITRPLDPEQFRSDVATQFNDTIQSLMFGALVDTGPDCMPSWMSWVDPATSDIYKIWLANTEFEEQYDDYTILVVPPIPNIDDFLGTYQTAVNKVNAVTPEQRSQWIIDKKAGIPESWLREMNFNYLKQGEPSTSNKTTWSLIINGKAGDNIDSIKDALRDYILSTSQYDEPVWKTIFPDIFSRTEFKLFPLWDQIAIPNLTVLSSLYGSMTNIKNLTQFLADATGESESVAQVKGQFFPHDYKCMLIAVMPGDTNPGDKSFLNTIFTDYIPVNTSSLDFSRMSPDTQDWVQKIQQCLMAAETATEFTIMPSGLRRVKRGNKFFVSLVFNNINYLVDFRSNTH